MSGCQANAGFVEFESSSLAALFHAVCCRSIVVVALAGDHIDVRIIYRVHQSVHTINGSGLPIPVKRSRTVASITLLMRFSVFLFCPCQ